MMSNNELDLFKEMMVDVAPIKQDTILIQQKYQVSEAQLTRRLAAQTLANGNIDYLSIDNANMIKPDDMIEFKRDGVQLAVFKKMRQGKYAIHARLDLHKKTLAQARDEVLAFLKQSQRLDIRTVMIIHGKGERSNPQALMKSFVATWLEQISDVLCFHSAQRQHGGTGALYVMIKKSAEKKQQTRDRHENHREA
ncbi:DNA endonuclease SmrA [Photobacterium iliopiscarium]|nr:DNA endonuclease SmrA [Photobacterium iliopiscarium]MCD9467828.1 DNA endonuclease SmrA [Photobacterium iliopiscarium]MCD9488994.1 DNA endonuclease SmrA [Photobacterium iliopiscarium]MCF2245685.1 DNA endonuclease SmrA [Photobacterium iliopiscarium]